MKKLAIVAFAALALTACSTPTGPAGSPSDSAAPSAAASATPSAAPSAAGFTLTSADFAAGDELADWATANAFGDQCTGDNLNPALEWSGAPEGTVSYAIVMVDRSAANFIHWVHFDIPADVTSVARGESSDLPGKDGRIAAPGTGYFGPCPPGGEHRYEFTVYALDAELGLESGAGLGELKPGIDEHLLAQASISGMRSGASE